MFLKIIWGLRWNYLFLKEIYICLCQRLEETARSTLIQFQRMQWFEAVFECAGLGLLLGQLLILGCSLPLESLDSKTLSLHKTIKSPDQSLSLSNSSLDFHLSRVSHGQRSLVGCSSWGHEESDMTERLHFHFSLSCIGEGNGNPLQSSCLENPRDGGAWWAAVIYGVAQSRTRLKWLSSSSSSRVLIIALHYLVSSLLPLTRNFFLYSVQLL